MFNNQERDDIRRIKSNSRSVYGFNFDKFSKEPQRVETDPSKLNLDEINDFLEFLSALNRNESKASVFLKKIPTSRIIELKEKYRFLESQLRILDSK